MTPENDRTGDRDPDPSRLAGLLKRLHGTVTDPDIFERVDRVSRDNLNEFGFDPFGYSPDYVKKVVPVLAALYRYYFRVRTYDIHHVPDAGRALLISNHSGQLPIDGAMIGTAALLDTEHPRIVRSMVERWVPTLPFASVFMARCGQVVGTRDNCRALLHDEETILVFPEGAAGISKPFKRRYQLERFGYGFMRLALETNTPIIPIAVVGAEEQAPAIWNAKRLARLVGAPAVPITPTFPLLGPLGLLPLPVRYHILFGEPMLFEGDHNDDEGTIGRKVKQVKRSIRQLIDRGLRERSGVFF